MSVFLFALLVPFLEVVFNAHGSRSSIRHLDAHALSDIAFDSQDDVEHAPGRRGGFGGGHSAGRSGGRSGGWFSRPAPRPASHPVAHPAHLAAGPAFPVARPAQQAQMARAVHPVAHPVARPGAPTYAVAPAYQQPPFTQPGYGKGHMAAAFVGGAVAGAGGMYLHDRMNSGYRHNLYSHGFGDTTVIHHHYHHNDGPYYSRQWNQVPPEQYKGLPPPSEKSLQSLQSSPEKAAPGTAMDAVLCIDAVQGSGLTLALHYRQASGSSLLTYGLDEINLLAGGSRDLGSIAEQMKSSDFTKLKQGLDFYVPLLEQKVSLRGIALNVMIGVVPNYKDNVTSAQEALDKLEWNNTKANFMVARVISAAWQAQLELETQWVQGFTGFMSIDTVSGARLAAASVGQQSFELQRQSDLLRWKELANKLDFDSELARIKSALTLKIPKASSLADVGSDAPETAANKVAGFLIAAGGFCDGAAASKMGCCEAETSIIKPTTSPAAASEPATKCQLWTKSIAVKQLRDAYTEAKTSFGLDMKSSNVSADQMLNIIYALAATDQWLDTEAQVVFAKPVNATLSIAIAVQLLALYDAPPTLAPTPPPRPSERRRKRRNDQPTSESNPNLHASHDQPKITLVMLLAMGVAICCCCCCFWRLCCSSSDSEDQIEYTEDEPGYMDCQCPPGCGPGSVVEVTLPNGAPHQVVVPEGVFAGMMFSVQI